jgi:hypothetical protein
VRQITNKPFVDVRQFQFTRVSGSGTSGSLGTPGAGKTITFSSCPLGVGGADAGHSVYISAGTGTAEAVLITGGTCTGLSTAAGTIVVTTANAHSGAWQVTSATGGMYEAILANSPRSVIVLPRQLEVYASTVITKSIGIRGLGGLDSAAITQNTADTPVFTMIGDTTLFDITLEDILIGPATGATPWSSRATIEIRNAGTVVVNNVRIYGSNGSVPAIYRGISMESCITCYITNNIIEHTVDRGIEVSGSGVRYTGDLWITGNTIHTTGGHGLHTGDYVAGVYIRNNEFYAPQNSYAIAIEGSQSGDCCYFITTNDISPVSRDGGLNAGGILMDAVGIIFVEGNNIWADQAPAISITNSVLDSVVTGNNMSCEGIACVSNAGAVKVLSNVFNGATAASAVGVSNTAAATQTEISSNQFQHFSGGGAVAVSLNASSTGNILQNNSCSNCATFATYTGTSITGGSNWALGSATPTLASAASITINPTSEAYFISGTTTVQTITGGWINRTIRIIFIDAAPGGVNVGGNIARAQAAVQYQSITLTFDGTNWF